MPSDKHGDRTASKRSVLKYAAAALVPLAGCSTGGDSTETASRTPSATPTPTDTPTATPTPTLTPIDSPTGPWETSIPQQSIDVTGGDPELSSPGVPIGDGFGIFLPRSWGRNPINEGTVWLRYDDSNLYLVARLQDESHNNSNRGQDMWSGDAIQFGVAGGSPEEATAWNEITMAKTNDGTDRAYDAVYEAGDKTDASGTISDPLLNITRDGTETLYRFGFAWDDMVSDAGAESDVLSISMGIINHNGDQIVGLTEWASGIFGGKAIDRYGTGQLE
jgi:hypothetical protein